MTPEGIRRILDAALEIAPGLADAEIVETWCGLRPDTPDHLPILGPTDTEGLRIATGHYRNGILLTPITAKLLAEWITREPTALRHIGHSVQCAFDERHKNDRASRIEMHTAEQIRLRDREATEKIQKGERLRVGSRFGGPGNVDACPGSVKVM